MSIVSLFRCKNCNEFICLDDTKLSRNGKKIPLDAKIPEGKRVRIPHKCSVKPFRKRYYGFRQIPDRTIKDKVKMFGYGNAPQTTYDTPEGTFSHVNRYQWRCKWCGTVYDYRIKAMKCCTEEEDYI